MKITLKNVRIHPDMSEETNCFSATIYADGKKAGTTQNSGKGGCNSYHWDNAQLGKQIEEWAEQQTCEFDFEKLDQCIDKLLASHEAIAQLKRWTKRETLFRLKADKPGEWRTIKALPAALVSPGVTVQQYLATKYGDQLDCIANLDLEAASKFRAIR